MTILRIDSSINGENSASRTLTDSIIGQLKAANLGEQLVTRDLVSSPLPHLTLDAFADSSVLDEFLAADVVVIGAPMYNFSVPSQLKAWIDRIAVAGKTFHYTADGPEGLVKGKRVIVALARGGFYGDGAPAASLEHVETYLKGVFNFIGVEPEFVIAEGLGISPEHRENSLKQAIGEVVLLAA
ncbi:NAD(P)H-dependent oxidoreductase [Sphingomonas sp. RB56-2]|uniref:FMN dependent NADH:quinone oxidoreductase n=1 Tax=Sphingomonas brevis TaxID=2908206 RepID=A0ABT0SA63_9SPHN|nr:NAD(P)H-dependent oxidoreductase [Sphingomonas brevis]MCL6741037.1 NAD(P)H-dependent oxidoreductase [Sphingomonas brevis]